MYIHTRLAPKNCQQNEPSRCLHIVHTKLETPTPLTTKVPLLEMATHCSRRCAMTIPLLSAIIGKNSIEAM